MASFTFSGNRATSISGNGTGFLIRSRGRNNMVFGQNDAVGISDQGVGFLIEEQEDSPFKLLLEKHPELAKEFVETVREQLQAGAAVQEATKTASERPSVKAWLVEHSVELASFALGAVPLLPQMATFLNLPPLPLLGG